MFHSIEKTATQMCYCGHCYFCVHSWKKKPNKEGRLLIAGTKTVWVNGPCTVWFVSDDAINNAKPGTIVQMQQMREPHPNVKRMNKGDILFKDQPDKLRELRGI